jgi:murein DD-endopeptidase MepM/ murein hydrolase activator NlpD
LASRVILKKPDFQTELLKCPNWQQLLVRTLYAKQRKVREQMKKRKNSPEKSLNCVWRRTLPAQSLCWLSSFSFLSSGMALAQTESAIDNIVPTNVETPSKAPAAKEPTVKPKPTATVPESDSGSPDFSNRRHRLSQRLRKNKPVETERVSRRRNSVKETGSHNRVGTRHRRNQQTDNVATRVRKSRGVEVARREATTPVVTPRWLKPSQQESVIANHRTTRKLQAKLERTTSLRQPRPRVIEFERPRVALPTEKPKQEISAPALRRTSQAKLPVIREQANRVVKKVNNISERPNVGETPKDYNNAYPTNYNAVARVQNNTRTPVVIAEKGEIIPPQQRRIISTNQAISNQPKTTTIPPSWVRKSQAMQLAAVTPAWTQRQNRSKVVDVVPGLRSNPVEVKKSGLISVPQARLPIGTRDQQRITNLVPPLRVPVVEATQKAIDNVLPPARFSTPKENPKQNVKANAKTGQLTPLNKGGVNIPQNNLIRGLNRVVIPQNNLPVIPSVNSDLPPEEGLENLPPPSTAENANPRPSSVPYNIPLATTLPQINFTGINGYETAGLVFPLATPAPITSLYGWRSHPLTGDTRFHSGTDIGAPMGTPILASYTGQVELADQVGGYGLTVVLNHNTNQQTLYGHMSEIYVQPGQWVEAGTVIGRVGSTGLATGPHLHFEVRQLTTEGWVAVDAGLQLQTALSVFMQKTQTARLLSQQKIDFN